IILLLMICRAEASLIRSANPHHARLIEDIKNASSADVNPYDHGDGEFELSLNITVNLLALHEV
ncbi:hypothetical protein PENTCL1PPCAC_24465, partial [Pristionchus entomophagus]